MAIVPIVEDAIRFLFLRQNLLRDSSERTKADYEISAVLAGLAGLKYELEFVAKRLRSDVDRVRLRTNTLVGPLDKLGLFPLLASIVFTWWLKLNEPTHPNVPDWFVGGVVGYLILYLLALNGTWRLHRFEELAQIAELASELKQQSETDAANPTARGEHEATHRPNSKKRKP